MVVWWGCVDVDFLLSDADMIMVVNLNLAIDYLVEVRGLATGEVHRATSSERLPGGKGVNVARVLTALDEACVVAGLLGGAAGREIERGLRSEGIAVAATKIRGESRTCVILNDREAGAQTVVNEPGPEIGAEEIETFVRRFSRRASEANIVVVTGSLPRGLAPNTYARLVDEARAAGAHTLVDCTGDALRAALDAGPYFVKINGDEAGDLLARSVATWDEAEGAAHAIRERGAENVAITLGAAGAVVLIGGRLLRVEPPRVDARNAVGSGDAFMAGLAAGLRRQLDAARTARLAVAAGAASALHGFGRCSGEEIASVEARVLSTEKPFV